MTISTSTTTSTSLRFSSSTGVRRVRLAGTPAIVSVSTTSDGDLGPSSRDAGTAQNRESSVVAPGPWRWARQVHGASVLLLDPQELCEGREGDAIVTRLPALPVAVFGADCGLIGLSSPEGISAAVHAGWRGLLAGVIEAATGAMRELGASALVAAVGPCIGPECYEFAGSDLELLVDRLGDSVRASTREGRPALDLSRGVELALEMSGVQVCSELAACTACDGDYFSWRARGDRGRHALVVSAHQT